MAHATDPATNPANGAATNPVADLLFDLDSPVPKVRLAAAFQLAGFLGREEVRSALAARLEREEEEEVRFCLRQVLGVMPGAAPPLAERGQTAGPASVSGTPPSKSGTPGPGGLSPENRPELIPGSVQAGDLLRAAPDRLPAMVASLRLLPGTEAAGIIAAVVGAGPHPNVLTALLDLGEGFPWEALPPERVTSLLRHPSPSVALPALHQAGKRCPRVCLQDLPDLLRSPSVSVRIFALRLLNRILPAEAARLLEEFLQSSDPSTRGVGIGLMFQFRFEEIAPMLVGLIEAQKVPLSSREVVQILIQSNPNPSFLERLSFLLLNRPELGDTLIPYARTAALALVLAEEEPGPADAVVRRYMEKAQSWLTRLLEGVPAAPPTPGPEPGRGVPGPPPVAPPPRLERGGGEGGASAGGPSDGPEAARAKAIAGFQAAATAEALSPEIRAALLEAARRRESDPAFLQAALPVIRKFAADPPEIRDWLLDLLDHPQGEIVLDVLALLGNHHPRAVLPHLAVLALHQNPSVVTQALRLLRKHEGSAFLRRIQNWLRDPDPRARRAGMAGLMQVDFERARDLVYSLLRSVTSLELLGDLGRILQMNPDHRSVAEIRRIAGTTTGPKQEFLRKLAETCQANISLATAGQGASAPDGAWGSLLAELRDKGGLEALLERVRAVRYEGEGAGYGRTLLFSAMALGVIGMALLWGIWPGRPSRVSEEVPRSGLPISTQAQRPARVVPTPGPGPKVAKGPSRPGIPATREEALEQKRREIIGTFKWSRFRKTQ